MHWEGVFEENVCTLEQSRLKRRDDSVIYTNVNIDPGKAYVMFVGDVKYAGLTPFLKRRLSSRYGKPVEVINVLPNMPPRHIGKNFIVANHELAEAAKNNGVKYFLPLDQIDIDRNASNSSYVKGIVKTILESQETLYINVFKNTPEMTLPDDERVHVIGPNPSLFTYFDDKINQKEIIEELSIPVPEGFVADSFEQLLKLYEEHFDGDAFVSCANGFGGNGCALVSCRNDIFSEKFCGKERFIISELLKLDYSPCSIGIVANRDEVMYVSVSDQLMNGVNYAGNIYPTGIGSRHKEAIKKYTTMIGRFLGKNGYKGCFGVDWMIDNNDRLYFTEINPRKVGHIPEITFAYQEANPCSISIPELEFLAVANGTFSGVDVFQYRMPSMHWGVSAVKMNKGHRTGNRVPIGMKEEEVFRYSGMTVLEHPGENIVHLADGKLARIVAVAEASVDEPRQEILTMLERGKGIIKII